jgi:hypothetical protein
VRDSFRFFVDGGAGVEGWGGRECGYSALVPVEGAESVGFAVETAARRGWIDWLINSKETTRYPTYEKIYMEEKGTQKLRMRKRGGWGTIGKTEEQGEKLGGVH